jgi:hypothetical protein
MALRREQLPLPHFVHRSKPVDVAVFPRDRGLNTERERLFARTGAAGYSLGLGRFSAKTKIKFARFNFSRIAQLHFDGHRADHRHPVAVVDDALIIASLWWLLNR